MNSYPVIPGVPAAGHVTGGHWRPGAAPEAEADDGHSYRQYGPDEVACSHCGHEPWQRPHRCPHPSRIAQHVGGGGLAATRERMRNRPR